jgi:Tfp pilus assembly protein PilO
MQLMEPQKSRAGIGPFIVSIFVSLAVAFFLTLPKYNQYQLARTAVENNKKTLAQINNQKSQISQLYEKVQANGDSIQKIDLAIPSKPDVPQIYAYIEGLSKSVNLTIGTLQAVDENEITDQGSVPGLSAAAGGAKAPGAVTLSQSGSASGGLSAKPAGPGKGSGVADLGLPGGVGAIDINLEVTGSYQNFVGFLSKLQNSLRIIDAQSVSVASTEGKTDLTFTVTLKTYYQK